MRKICYHVATTLDGFIARADGSIDGFLPGGDHVEDYQSSLAEYDTVIMGRCTYEFGYDYGLEPGARAYPHMQHYIFSRTLNVEAAEGVHIVGENWLEKIDDLRNGEGVDIYLCGGSVFAGWLLDQRRVDRLKLKLNPVVFGAGLKLFSTEKTNFAGFKLTNVKQYESGVMLLDYELTGNR
ncbi:MAG: dihydrofolate reductase [Marinicaulis sp.]|nr:dihydrofolate reductase [Marinicaulis sp.]